MMQLSPKLIALSLLLVSTSVLSIELYKWKDEDGKVHYGQVKPTKYKTLEIDAPPPPPTFAPNLNEPYEKQIRDSMKKESKEPEVVESVEDKKARLAQCEKVKANLEKLKTYGRIRVNNPDGSTSVMTDEEKQAKIAASQKQIDSSCK